MRDNRKVLMIHQMDLAGSPYRMEYAINHFLDGWEARRVQKVETFQMGFPRGLTWSNLGELSEQADIVHIHHIYFSQQVIPQLSGNPKIVVSVRGSPDREKKTPVPKEVDFLHSCHWDLLGTYPQATVIPNFILTKDIEPYGPSGPEEITQPNRIKVFQPVAHKLKHPEEFEKVKAATSRQADFISQEGKHCKVKNSDQLENMSKCHISWDNLQHNFGNNSIEALALGLLPITSLGKDTVEGLCGFFNVFLDSLPYHFHGGSDEISKSLIELSKDPEGLLSLRKQAHQFWREGWMDKHIIQKWGDIYGGLL